MKQTIGRREFHAAFETYNRSNQFPNGLDALFDYLEQLEADTGEEIELDVIGLCCDFTEICIDDIPTETGLESVEELREHTTVIEVDEGTIIYQNF